MQLNSLSTTTITIAPPCILYLWHPTSTPSKLKAIMKRLLYKDFKKTLLSWYIWSLALVSYVDCRALGTVELHLSCKYLFVCFSNEDQIVNRVSAHVQIFHYYDSCCLLNQVRKCEKCLHQGWLMLAMIGLP